MKDFLSGARDYFRACPNCEPVGCCSGQECGCQGMPVDFKVTDKCGDDCLPKVIQERNKLKAELEHAKSLEGYRALGQQIVEALEQRDEIHRALLAREETLKQSGKDWVKAMTERDEARAEATRAWGQVNSLTVQNVFLKTRVDDLESILYPSATQPQNP